MGSFNVKMRSAKGEEKVYKITADSMTDAVEWSSRQILKKKGDWEIMKIKEEVSGKKE